MWGLAGMMLYVAEMVMRQYRGSTHIFVTSVHFMHPVMEVRFRPRHASLFKFLEGQYVYLNVPYISKTEWHPFTISSAVGDLERGGDEGWISVHIRIIPGGWTEKLLRYFLAIGGKNYTSEQLKKEELSIELFHRNELGEMVGQNRGIMGEPLLRDGPHAAPAQHYGMYEHVMMIGRHWPDTELLCAESCASL